MHGKDRIGTRAMEKESGSIEKLAWHYLIGRACFGPFLLLSS